MVSCEISVLVGAGEELDHLGHCPVHQLELCASEGMELRCYCSNISCTVEPPNKGYFKADISQLFCPL